MANDILYLNVKKHLLLGIRPILTRVSPLLSISIRAFLGGPQICGVLGTPTINILLHFQTTLHDIQCCNIFKNNEAPFDAMTSNV